MKGRARITCMSPQIGLHLDCTRSTSSTSLAMAAPALRTRRSAADARVTLFSLGPPTESPDVKPEASTSSSPATRSSRKSRVKTEDDDAVTAGSARASSPVTPRKRARKTKAEQDASDEEEDEKKPKRPSMSPRKSTPTKLRAKLEQAHPEPARWRETYEIVSNLLCY